MPGRQAAAQAIMAGTGLDRVFFGHQSPLWPHRGASGNRYRLRCAQLVRVQGSGEPGHQGAHGGERGQEALSPGPALNQVQDTLR
jgi:hypothetical protein